MNSRSHKDYYAILGLYPSCSIIDIKKAYHKLARKYHPDVTLLDKSYAAHMMTEISEAYRVLSDPESRSEYDWIVSEPEIPAQKPMSPYSSNVNIFSFSVPERFKKNNFLVVLYFLSFAVSKIRILYKLYPSTVRYAFGLFFLIFFNFFWSISETRAPVIPPSISKSITDCIEPSYDGFSSFTGLSRYITYNSFRRQFPMVELEPAGNLHGINRYNCILPSVPFKGFPSHSNVIGFDSSNRINMVSYKFAPEDFGIVRDYFYAALGPFLKQNDMYVFEADKYRVVLLPYGSDNKSSVTFFVVV